MKSKEEIKKWHDELMNHYMSGAGDPEERFRLEVEIETLESVLGIEHGTFEPIQQ